MLNSRQLCAAIRFQPELTDVRIIGMDEQHRPVIFQSYTGSSDHSASALKMNNICIMEKAMQCMSAHAPHSVVFVYDLGAHRKNGLSSLKDQGRIASAVKKVTKIFQDHYPVSASITLPWRLPSAAAPCPSSSCLEGAMC